MNHFRKTLSLLLCLVLSCSLIALPSAFAEGTGGYEEALLEAPEGYAYSTGPTVAPDGSFSVAALHTESRSWHLLTWQDVSSPPTAVPLAYEGGMLNAIDYAPDGSLLGYVDSYAYDISTDEALDALEGEAASGGPEVTETTEDEGLMTEEFVYNADDYSVYYFWFAQDGSLLSRFEANGMAMQVKALSGQRAGVYDGMTDQFAIYDAEGKETASASTGYVFSLAADAENLYGFSFEGLAVYNLQTLEKTAEYPITVEYGTQAYLNDDGLYTLGSSGLQKIDPATGTILFSDPFSGTLASDPTSLLTGFGVLPDGTVLCSVVEGAGSAMGGITYVDEGMGGQMIAYQYNADLDLSGREDFRIVALRSDAVLRKAINDFQRAHPELNVQLETLLGEGNEDAAIEDGIRTLNTQLLAGQGGDVMILDDLPVEKYIRKGLLMDLSDELGNVDLLPGVLSGSYSADGALYAVPTRFRFDSLWGNKDLISSVDSLESLTTLTLDNGQSLLAPRTHEQWLELFYPASETAFRDENGALNFENQSFIDFLNTMYTLYTSQADLPAESPQDGGNLSVNDMQNIMNGASVLFPDSFASLINTSISYSLSGGEEGGFIPTPSVSGKGASYTPVQLAGVSSNAKNPTAAKEFVRHLLSPEMQSLEADTGLPVTEAALDAQIASYEKLRDEGGIIMVSTGEGNPIEMRQPESHTWENVRDLCMEVNQPYAPDRTLMGFIAEETEAFFAGQITAEQAAQALQQRAWSYLNE